MPTPYRDEDYTPLGACAGCVLAHRQQWVEATGQRYTQLSGPELVILPAITMVKGTMLCGQHLHEAVIGVGEGARIRRLLRDGDHPQGVNGGQG